MVAQNNAAGQAAVNKSPRVLPAVEQAGIARLCRQQYDADDEAMRAAIEECERCMAIREHLLALVPN